MLPDMAMRKNNPFFKILARIVVISFLYSDILYAVNFTQAVQPKRELSYIQIPAFKPFAVNLCIPEEYGVIAKSYGQTDTIPSVVLISDAHCNYEAQINISNILKILIKQYGINFIAVEGAENIVDISMLSKYPDEKIKEDVIDRFVKDGYVTGPEFLKIVKNNNLPFTLYGIEDSEIYKQNYEAMRDSVKQLKQMKSALDEAKNLINSLKSKIYSAEMTDFDNKTIQYEANNISISEYAKLTMGILLKHNFGQIKTCYPNFRYLIVSNFLEDKINFEKLNKERADILTYLEDTLVQEDLKDLAKHSLEFKLGKLKAADYYGFLYNKTVLSAYRGTVSNLRRYAKLQKLYSKISTDVLINEIRDLQTQIYEIISTNIDQKELIDISRTFTVYNKLIHLKLSPYDYKYINSSINSFGKEMLDRLNTLGAKYGLNKIEFDIDTVYPSLFYKIAEKRNVIMSGNLMERLFGGQKAVLVTGGFHTEGISKIFEDNNVSHVIIRPKIINIDESPYFSIIESLNGIGKENLALPPFVSIKNKVIKALGLAGVAIDLHERIITAMEKYYTDRDGSDLLSAIPKDKNNEFKAALQGELNGEPESVQRLLKELFEVNQKIENSTELRKRFDRLAVPVRLLWHGGQISDIKTISMLLAMFTGDLLELDKHNSNLIELYALTSGYAHRIELFREVMLSSNPFDSEVIKHMEKEYQSLITAGKRICQLIEELPDTMKQVFDGKEVLFGSFVAVMEQFYRSDYKKEKITVGNLIDKALDTIKISYKKSLLNDGVLEIDPASRDIEIECDPVLTAFALGEIFINAYLMSPAEYKNRSNPINVTKVKISSDNGNLIIEDNGPGFPTEMLQKTILPDRQDAFVVGVSKREGGTGLGLGLLWYVLNDQGYDITADNKSSLKEGGARFVVKSEKRETKTTRGSPRILTSLIVFLTGMFGFLPEAFARSRVLEHNFLSAFGTAVYIYFFLFVFTPIICVLFTLFISCIDNLAEPHKIKEDFKKHSEFFPPLLFAGPILITLFKLSDVIGAEHAVIYGMMAYYLTKYIMDSFKLKLKKYPKRISETVKIKLREGRQLSPYFKIAVVTFILTTMAFFMGNLLQPYMKHSGIWFFEMLAGHFLDFLAVPLFTLLTPIIKNYRVFFYPTTVLMQFKKVFNDPIKLLKVILFWALFLTVVAEFLPWLGVHLPGVVNETPDIWDVFSYFLGGAIFYVFSLFYFDYLRDFSVSNTAHGVFEPAKLSELKEVTLAYNKAWRGNTAMQFKSYVEMQTLIENEMVFVLKVNNEIKAVLLTSKTNTSGDLSVLDTNYHQLWTDMMNGKQDEEDCDTVIFWSISIEMDDEDKDIDYEELCISGAYDYFEEVPYKIEFFEKLKEIAGSKDNQGMSLCAIRDRYTDGHYNDNCSSAIKVNNKYFNSQTNEVSDAEKLVSLYNTDKTGNKVQNMSVNGQENDYRIIEYKDKYFVVRQAVLDGLGYSEEAFLARLSSALSREKDIAENYGEIYKFSSIDFSGLPRVIVLEEMSASPFLGANCTGDGWIGINSLINQIKNTSAKDLLFEAVILHELWHEADKKVKEQQLTDHDIVMLFFGILNTDITFDIFRQVLNYYFASSTDLFAEFSRVKNILIKYLFENDLSSNYDKQKRQKAARMLINIGNKFNPETGMLFYGPIKNWLAKHHLVKSDYDRQRKDIPGEERRFMGRPIRTILNSINGNKAGQLRKIIKAFCETRSINPPDTFGGAKTVGALKKLLWWMHFVDYEEDMEITIDDSYGLEYDGKRFEQLKIFPAGVADNVRYDLLEQWIWESYSWPAEKYKNAKKMSLEELAADEKDMEPPAVPAVQIDLNAELVKLYSNLREIIPKDIILMPLEKLQKELPEKRLDPELLGRIMADAGLYNSAGEAVLVQINKLVEDTSTGLNLTADQKKLIIFSLCEWHFLNVKKAPINQQIENGLNNMGYSCKVKEIMRLLSDIQKIGINSMSDYYFVTELEKLLGFRNSEIFTGMCIRKPNLTALRGKTGNMFADYWRSAFNSNLASWELLANTAGVRDPKGIIVQHITNFGPGFVNWLMGLKKNGFDTSGVKFAFVMDGLSPDEKYKRKNYVLRKLKELNGENILFVEEFAEIMDRPGNKQRSDIVYISDDKDIEKTGSAYPAVKFIKSNQAGPVLEMNLALMLLDANNISAINKVYTDFLMKLSQDKVISLKEDEIAGLVKRIMEKGFIYIILPQVTQVQQMWDEFREFDYHA
jgi:signal transduction histidine kinase